VSMHQRKAPASRPANGGDTAAFIEGLEALASGLIAAACDTLREKGGLHALDRRRVKTGVGY
jgi:hypothetical protein